MLFSEFQENTGCKDNHANYQLYKRLEIIYMNDDTVTKADIYEMGKKLMDNSKSEEEIRFETQIREEIKAHKENIKSLREEIKQYQAIMENEYEPWFKKTWRTRIKSLKEDIRREKTKINELLWVLGEN